MNSKNDSQDKKNLSDSVNSFDLLEYNNIYDELNPYFINSYDIDTELSITTPKQRGDLKVVSNDDKIEFIHNDNVSERHQQIHDKTDEKTSSTSKKTISSTSKNVNSKFEDKKKEIRERLNNKTHYETAKSSSEVTNRTYTHNQYKSKPSVESYSTKKQEKKNSNGCIGVIIFIFLFGSSILGSCMEFVGNSLEDFTNSYDIESFFSSNKSNDDNDSNTITYYDGDKSDLTAIYEMTDQYKEHAYYYDYDGNLYDSNYALIENYENLNFAQNIFARLQLLKTTSLHSNDPDFVTAFVEPNTYRVFYVKGYTFYDTDDNIVDSGTINIPSNIIDTISRYHANKSNSY